MTSKDELAAWLTTRARALGSMPQALVQARALLLRSARDAPSSCLDLFPRPSATALAAARASGTLCRCRAMIQEVQSDILLYAASRTRFFDDDDDDDDDDDRGSRRARDRAHATDRELMDAVQLYVLPVPGNTHLYNTSAHDDNDNDGDDEEAVVVTVHRRSNSDSEGGSAAATATTMPCSGVSVAARRDDTTSAPCAGVKRTQRTAVVADDGDDPHATAASLEAYLNLPHPAASPTLQTGCVVTVMLPRDTTAAASDTDAVSSTTALPPLRVNEVVELYGYLQHAVDHTDGDDEDDAFGAWRASRLRASVVPRLLCLAWAPVTHTRQQQRQNDDDDAACATRQQEQPQQQRAHAFAERRRASVAYVTRALCAGDALAAEYVLLHLCGSVRSHHAMTPVGDVPLLVRSPHIDAAVWSRVLRRLSPAGEVLLSRASLDAAAQRVLPRHDADGNYLRSGLLQIGNGSHLTIDCRDLLLHSHSHSHSSSSSWSQHHHDDASPPWADAMFALMHRQVLPLAYPYQTLELPVSVACLALVPADKNAVVHPLFDFALQLPWQPRCRHHDEDDGDEDDEDESGSSERGCSRGAAALSSSTTTRAEAAKACEGDSVAAVDAAAVRAYVADVRQVALSCAAVDDAADADDAAVQQQLAQALTRMASDVAHWANRDALVHNNTFSAVTSLLRAHAASLGRAHVAAHDVEYVMQLERRRMQRFTS